MKPQKPPKQRSTLRNAAALTGIAFEMGAIIFLAAKGGQWLDAHFGTQKAIFTAFSTLLGVGISIYLVLQQLKRLQN